MPTSFQGTHNKLKLEFCTQFLRVFLQPPGKVQILIHDFFGFCFLISVSAGYSKRDGPTKSSPGHSLVKTSLHASVKNKRHQNDKFLGEKSQTLKPEAKVLDKLCLL